MATTRWRDTVKRVRLRKAFRKIYTKLVRELEKKFSGKVRIQQVRM
ncbi:hypothetical protein CCACVL1_27516 [Corchorus capsularis]|uniref:Uncharacterized protein n=1 Tax=Corchorus capsularis TaxID=210143 RepID=A0A1R3G9U6_COCAP|nr:hypothetical protein CCACVL1_27516 [Corchorus capsularis]